MNTSFLPNEPILGPDFLSPGNQITRTAYAQAVPHSKSSRHFTRAERSRHRLGVRNASSAFDPSVGKWRTVWCPSARTRGQNSPSLFPILTFGVSAFQLFSLFHGGFDIFPPLPQPLPNKMRVIPPGGIRIPPTSASMFMNSRHNRKPNANKCHEQISPGTDAADPAQWQRLESTIPTSTGQADEIH